MAFMEVNRISVLFPHPQSSYRFQIVRTPQSAVRTIQISINSPITHPIFAIQSAAPDLGSPQFPVLYFEIPTFFLNFSFPFYHFINGKIYLFSFYFLLFTPFKTPFALRWILLLPLPSIQ
jgi:hypothetical protein